MLQCVDRKFPCEKYLAFSSFCFPIYCVAWLRSCSVWSSRELIGENKVHFAHTFSGHFRQIIMSQEQPQPCAGGCGFYGLVSPCLTSHPSISALVRHALNGFRFFFFRYWSSCRASSARVVLVFLSSAHAGACSDRSRNPATQNLCSKCFKASQTKPGTGSHTFAFFLHASPIAHTR